MTQDDLKRNVARAAIDYLLPKIQRQDVLGIGTGSTANHFIDLLAQHKTQFSSTVASSEASAQRLRHHDIEVVDLNEAPALTYYIDGADEANASLQLIKGGGAALTREKIVAASAKQFICIADDSKWVDKLGKFPLPVEVIPMAIHHVSQKLAQLGGKPVIRADVVTDNGGAIIDVHDLDMDDPVALEETINHITGVVTNGIFARRSADVLLLGSHSGVQLIQNHA